MNTFSIRDIEQLTGIKAHTLRIWEQRYGIIDPKRSDTNIRSYSNDDLKSILNIALLNKYGHKISRISQMTSVEIKENVLNIPSPEAHLERMINDLVRDMIDIDMVHFTGIIEKNIATYGIEKTILQLIFPFLEKIGILWLTSHINPAQEHLVSNIIRQKLIVGIDGLPEPGRPGKLLLLYLPEGEHHEIGLLFMHYIFKSRGSNVIYLGANVPQADVEFVVKLKKPDYIYSHLSTAGNYNFEKFLDRSSRRFSGIPVIISGQLTTAYQKKVKSPIQFKKSFEEVMDFVSNL